MKKILFFLFFFVPLLYAQNTMPKNQFLSTSAFIVYQVIHIDKSQNEIIEFIRKEGGYFTLRENNLLRIKINPEKISSLIEFLKAKGIVLQQDIKTQNYQERINQLKVIIKTQEESLANIYQLYSMAGLDQVLDIEIKIREMLEELENARGELRFIQERIRFCYVEISFKSHSVLSSSKKEESPFEWINKLGLQNLFKDE